MCTVTYVPIKEGEFIVTHNRDEKLTRLPSELPAFKTFENRELLYPMDKDKNGTWFCTNRQGRIACILNGGHHPHVSNPPYKKSRGIVVLESLLSDSFLNWAYDYDFRSIEPFTMILIERNQELIELVWDGEFSHIKPLPTDQPHIWSSSTLYTPEAKKKRSDWLDSWLEENPHTPSSLFDFHNYGGSGEAETNLKMEILGSHKTVSITQVYSSNSERFMDHENFSTGESIKLPF